MPEGVGELEKSGCGERENTGCIILPGVDAPGVPMLLAKTGGGVMKVDGMLAKPNGMPNPIEVLGCEARCIARAGDRRRCGAAMAAAGGRGGSGGFGNAGTAGRSLVCKAGCGMARGAAACGR